VEYAAKSQTDDQDRRTAAERVSQPTVAEAFADNRPEAAAQRKLREEIERGPRVAAQRGLSAGTLSSPLMVGQRQQLRSMFGNAAQLEGEPEEEELQMKAPPGVLQRQGPEEEELLQGRFQTLQRQGTEEEELLQGKFESVQRQELEEEELIQGEFTPRETPTHQGQQENRTGLSDHLKAGLETLSGMPMDDVKVHYNSPKPAQLNALAYTHGTDIHVGPGQAKHLAHEGWHVVQQKQGQVRSTIEAQGVAINDDEGLEREADVMGAKAAVHQASKSILSASSESQIESGSFDVSSPQVQFSKGGSTIQRFPVDVKI